MSIDFHKKDLIVMVAESSVPMRNMISASFKKLGFSNITAASDIGSTIEMMEAEPVDWVIARFDPTQSPNGLQFLEMVLDNIATTNAKLSLLVDEESMAMLPYAYSRGLLSHHENFRTAAEFEAEAKALMERFENYDLDLPLVSCHYLHDALKKLNIQRELIVLHQAIMRKFPGRADQLLRAGEAYILNGQEKEGVGFLKQATSIKPSLQEDLNIIGEEYQIDVASVASTYPPVDALGIEKVAVLTQGGTEAGTIEACLKGLGSSQLQFYTDFEEFIQGIKESGNIHLAIFDWAIPGCPGPILLQKVQRALKVAPRIIVVGKGVSSEEKPLLQELGVVGSVGLPIVNEEFVKAVVTAVQVDVCPKDVNHIFAKAVLHLKQDKMAEAYSWRDKYRQHPDATVGHIAHLDAEFCYYAKDFAKARQLGLEAIKHMGASPTEVLNLLGKSLMKMRDFEGAIRCLRNAYVLSPKNLTRLCSLADCFTESGDDQGFDQVIGKAEALDAGAEPILEAKMKNFLTKGQTEAARAIAGKMNSLMGILAFTNNRAIALIRNQQFDEGIELYRGALAALPDRKAGIRAVLHYNLGLAFARRAELEKSQTELESGAACQDKRMGEKIDILLNKVKHAIASDVPIEFSSMEAPPIRRDLDSEEIEKVLSMIGSEHCCYNIFFTEAPTAYMKMIKKKVSFNPREAIRMRAQERLKLGA